MTVAFDTIAAHIRERSGLSLGPDKLYLLETRLAAILRQENLPDLGALARQLNGRPGGALSQAVVEALTTNESLFFRDTTPFQHLRDKVLPRLKQPRPATRPLRIWSAAAAAGQEAYSLAMTVADTPDLLDARAVEILGTDIARGALNRARGGRYSRFEVGRGLDGAQLARWFVQDCDGWRANSRLRRMVTFREWNLLSNLKPLGLFDIVFCRNVLLYFDPSTKHRVLTAILRQLAPGGSLYLGASELPIGLDASLTRSDPSCSVYTKE